MRDRAPYRSTKHMKTPSFTVLNGKIAKVKVCFFASKNTLFYRPGGFNPI